MSFKMADRRPPSAPSIASYKSMDAPAIIHAINNGLDGAPSTMIMSVRPRTPRPPSSPMPPSRLLTADSSPRTRPKPYWEYEAPTYPTDVPLSVTVNNPMWTTFDGTAASSLASPRQRTAQPLLNEWSPLKRPQSARVRGARSNARPMPPKTTAMLANWSDYVNAHVGTERASVAKARSVPRRVVALRRELDADTEDLLERNHLTYRAAHLLRRAEDADAQLDAHDRAAEEQVVVVDHVAEQETKRRKEWRVRLLSDLQHGHAANRGYEDPVVTAHAAAAARAALMQTAEDERRKNVAKQRRDELEAEIERQNKEARMRRAEEERQKEEGDARAAKAKARAARLASNRSPSPDSKQALEMAQRRVQSWIQRVDDETAAAQLALSAQKLKSASHARDDFKAMLVNSKEEANRRIAERKAELEEAAKEGLHRYTEPEYIWKALAGEQVRLVRMSWLLEHALAPKRSKKPGSAGGGGGAFTESGVPLLPRRQDLPEKAFIPLEELQKMYKQSRRQQSRNVDQALPVIAISLGTGPSARRAGTEETAATETAATETAAATEAAEDQDQQHPDPDGMTLQRIARALQREAPKYKRGAAGWSYAEMGVFWPWASLYQGGSAGASSSTAMPRSPQQEEAYQYALTHTLDLWYSHQGVTVYLDTRQPGYDESGWGYFEACCAEQIRRHTLVDGTWRLTLDLDAGDEGEVYDSKWWWSAQSMDDDPWARTRAWPVGPSDFDAALKAKCFVDDEERTLARQLYRKMSVRQLCGVTRLSFVRMPNAPTAEDASRLGALLSHCVRLESLNLQGCGLDDDSTSALFSALSKDALGQLKELRLGRNGIGDAGVQALVMAVSDKGAMASLEVLGLEDNAPLAEGSLRALTYAISQGQVFPHLKQLIVWTMGSRGHRDRLEERARQQAAGAGHHSARNSATESLWGGRKA